jgi:acyl carrier protein
MPDDVRDAVASIVADIAGRRANIDDGASLFHDLGIAGDDAAELFGKLHKKFGTQFDDLALSKFFPDETEALVYNVAGLFGYRSRKPEITLGHLVRVVEHGSWFDPADPNVTSASPP